ncbi:hypothetical protein V6574_29295 [Streptomyces sp. SM1P]
MDDLRPTDLARRRLLLLAAGVLSPSAAEPSPPCGRPATRRRVREATGLPADGA